MPRKKSDDEWSRKPQAIRRRLRMANGNIDRDLAMLEEAMNYKPVAAWDFEELSKGRPKDENGKFLTGPRPKWITPRIMIEIRGRLQAEAGIALSAQLTAAMDCIKQLIESDDVDYQGRPIVDARTRLDAAKFVIEQTLGKAKVAVELGTIESYREFLAGALVLPSGKQAHPVIAGTATFNEEDDE